MDNIVELTKQTGKNLAEFILHIAEHIEKLENENAELRRQLDIRNNVSVEDGEGI